MKIGHSLTARIALAVTTLAASGAFSGTALAVPGGTLDTLPPGSWTCETPGDAATPPVLRAEENFIVVPDSSYVTADGERGTYLLLGDQVTMTSGPRKGNRFRLESAATLNKLTASGTDAALRCVKAGDPTAIAPAAAKPGKAANEAAD